MKLLKKSIDYKKNFSFVNALLLNLTLIVISPVVTKATHDDPPSGGPTRNGGETCAQNNAFDITSAALCQEMSNLWGIGKSVTTINDANKSKGCNGNPFTLEFYFNEHPTGTQEDDPWYSFCTVAPTTNSGGDPHFIGFHNNLITYQGECSLVLLDSPAATATGDDVTIHVRTTRKLDFSYISGVAMKMGEEVVEVTPNADILLNGNVITGEGVTMSGLPFVLTKEEKGTKKMIVSYSFDIGNRRVIDVQANKKRSMMFVRTKGMFPAETVGMLGSPDKKEMVSRDGKVLMTDIDVNAYGESWQVKDTDEQLFQEPLGPQYPQKCLYEDAPGATAQLRGRRKLLAKKVVTVEEARAACASVPGELKRELCVQDSIAMGDLDLVDDPFYMD